VLARGVGVEKSEWLSAIELRCRGPLGEEEAEMVMQSVAVFLITSRRKSAVAI
jgi:hypothetical protein